MNNGPQTAYVKRELLAIFEARGVSKSFLESEFGRRFKQPLIIHMVDEFDDRHGTINISGKFDADKFSYKYTLVEGEETNA